MKQDERKIKGGCPKLIDRREDDFDRLSCPSDEGNDEVGVLAGDLDESVSRVVGETSSRRIATAPVGAPPWQRLDEREYEEDGGRSQ